MSKRQSGRAALHRIDEAIAEARHCLSKSGDTAAADARAILEIDQARAEIFHRLADIRIDLIRDDAADASLGAADRKAASLIEQHDAHLSGLAGERDKAEGAIEKLEAERRAGEENLEAAVAAHDEAAEKTRARLEASTAYQARADAVAQADAVAERAAQKLELARETRAEKGAPYEDDPLFSYLWARDFATRDYRAFPLFAMLDGWVARLIRYRDAQLNYRRLLELPERLEEHAARVDEAASAAADALEAYEREALQADGVGALREAVERARADLEKLDDAIVAAEESHERLVGDHADAAAGKSGPLNEARSHLAEALARQSVPDLKLLAAETATLSDDRLVDDLIRLKRERLELEDEREDLERATRRHRDTLSELEDLRRKFKRARYDSPYSEFSGQDIVSVLLSEFLRGALGQGDLWRRLQRAQRTRRRDWSNTRTRSGGGAIGGRDWRGGFGLPDNWGGDWTNSDWGRPGSGNWGGGRPPRTRSRPPRTRLPRRPRPPRVRFPKSRGGGGFRTGGGF